MKNGFRILDVRPDTVDFRDKVYQGNVDASASVDLNEYLKFKVPVLNQATEGNSAAFGLATVANYLLRRRNPDPDTSPVSFCMFAAMSQRYDIWGEKNWIGSTARFTLKGWHKHGVCSEALWPYGSNMTLTERRASDAGSRPLSSYWRVNHRDLAAIHSALCDAGILYATAIIHGGWDGVAASNPVIPLTKEQLGGHAFAIIGYNKKGFWIQNSWGSDWGRNGIALITYDDWLANGVDVWLARLGVPITLDAASSTVRFSSEEGISTSNQLRPHVIRLGTKGLLQETGTYGTSLAQVKNIFRDDFPRITKTWKKKRLLLYADGGLIIRSSAVDRVAGYLPGMLNAEVYLLALLWQNDFWTTLENILENVVRRISPKEGFTNDSYDFMLGRLDDALEPLCRTLGGQTVWEERKENAMLATTQAVGGYRVLIGEIKRLLQQDPSIELHLVGYSGGAILHAPAVQMLAASGLIKTGRMRGTRGLGINITSCTLWAPACTIDLFNETYMPAIKARKIKQFRIFTLTDEAEKRDNCSRIYNKSLLYLVSNAFEQAPRIPLFREGTPILGMEKFLIQDSNINEQVKSGQIDWIRAPNTEHSTHHSTAQRHVDFDTDIPTLTATLSRICRQYYVSSTERKDQHKRFTIAPKKPDKTEEKLDKTEVRTTQSSGPLPAYDPIAEEEFRKRLDEEAVRTRLRKVT